jgi:hypothetical protein
MPESDAYLSECIPACATVIPESSKMSCSYGYHISRNYNATSQCNLNPLSPVSLNNVMKCDPLANDNPCTGFSVSGHSHLKQNQTMINFISNNQNCRKYDHEYVDSSQHLTKNRPQTSTKNLCLRSVGKPKEDSFVSVSGCEFCAILRGSNFCHAHNLNAIGPTGSFSRPCPHYYGYDSGCSGAETEMHCYNPRFYSQSSEGADQIPVCVDVQINSMTGAKSSESNFKVASSEELKQSILCGSKISTLKEMPVKYFCPETEHRRLKFMKTEDDSTTAVIRESHSVEVLGSYSTKQVSNTRNNTVVLKSSAPCRLISSKEDFGRDSNTEDGGYLSSISDKRNANSYSDELVSSNVTTASKSRSLVFMEDIPHKLNTAVRTIKCPTDKPCAVETDEKDEIPERSTTKCVVLKDDDVLGCNRNENRLNNKKEQSKLNIAVGNNDNTDFSCVNNDSTDFSCGAGECDRDSAISSQRNLEMITHNSSLCATSPRNLKGHFLSQSELISVAGSITDNINSKKSYEIGDKNHISASLYDACTIHQTNSVSYMPEIYSSWISSGKIKASVSTCSEKSCNSRLPDDSSSKDALSCVPLISEMLEIRSPPEGKAGYRNCDEDNNIYLIDSEDAIDDNVDNLELLDYCKNNMKTSNVGHERESISYCNAVGSTVEINIDKNSGFPEQHSCNEFAYCKSPMIHKQPVADSHAETVDANCYPLLMPHAVTPLHSIMTANLELQQHTHSARNGPLSCNECSDYGSSSGGGGGQRMAIHHSGAQGANSSSGSKRNTFTRSLSNAEVPPDEKAGKCKNELVRCKELIYVKVNVFVINLNKLEVVQH